ncbi:MAG: hypothetical protein M3457_00225 [Chloroflexota bacterium]|nr:hypothetical protein [Chloroflexota bacterium]
MSRQPRKKTARALASVPEPGTTVTLTGEPIVDHQGYLAIGLAATVVTIVALIVVMIILAAI